MLRNIIKYAKRAVKTGVVIGGLITVYQAARKTKKKNGGKFKWNKFVGNFQGQASKNIKLVAKAAKGLIGKFYSRCRVPDKVENGYVYKNAEPENEKSGEIFEAAPEGASNVIDKVQDFVDDVRENAPENQAKAQEYIEDVKDTAIKALEPDNSEDELKKTKEKNATTDKPEKEVKVKKAAKPVKEAKAEKAKKPEKETKPEKEKKPRKPKQTAKTDKAKKDKK